MLWDADFFIKDYAKLKKKKNPTLDNNPSEENKHLLLRAKFLVKNIENELKLSCYTHDLIMQPNISLSFWALERESDQYWPRATVFLILLILKS